MEHHDLSALLEFRRATFPEHDIFFVVRNLSYFDDAETELDPVLRHSVNWDQVKARIREAI